MWLTWFELLLAVALLWRSLTLVEYQLTGAASLTWPAQSHISALSNITPREAKYWIVFIIELKLLLLCFGLSALYMYTCQHRILPAGPASIHPRTQCMSLYDHRRFISQRRRAAPPPPFLSRYVIYLCLQHGVICITSRGAEHCRLLKNLNLLLTYSNVGLRHCTMHMHAHKVAYGNISVDFSLFVLLHEQI